LAAPATPVALSDAVHQTIDAIVTAEIGKHNVGVGPAPLHPATAATNAPLAPAPDAARPRLSEVLKLYLAPPHKKRAGETRGRPDTAPIVQFAVDFLKDPVFDGITEENWKKLDEAMTDIPHPKGVPDDHRSLFQRYQYAKETGWDELSRVTITTVVKGYHYGRESCLRKPKLLPDEDFGTHRANNRYPDNAAAMSKSP